MLLLKVGQFSLRIYCLLTYFVTMCLILKESKECLGFLKSHFLDLGLFSIDINPNTHTYTEIQKHIHTCKHNTASPSRRTAIG